MTEIFVVEQITKITCNNYCYIYIYGMYMILICNNSALLETCNVINIVKESWNLNNSYFNQRCIHLKTKIGMCHVGLWPAFQASTSDV